MCILLGVQHFLTCFGSTVSIPLILAPAFCLGDNDHGNLVKAYLISTIFVGSGICTLLQSTFGNRLPLLQGGTFSFLTPTFALMSLAHFQCSNVVEMACIETPNETSGNWSIHGDQSCCQVGIDCPDALVNSTTMFKDVTNANEPALVEWDEVWQRRLREVQGAIISASLVELGIGLTGLVGVFLQLISPLAIAPVITLIGMSLYKPAVEMAGKCWTISGLTIFSVVLFSQYLRNVDVPLVKYSFAKKKASTVRYPLFKVFPVLLGLVTSWLLCAILTAAANNNSPGMELMNNSSSNFYHARTDLKLHVLSIAPWFRFVYPFQWGLPTFSAAGTIAILSGVLASIIESIGDYYACAEIAEIPPPPVHAINRGIMMEGVACVIDGLLGSGNGTTTYSENIGTLRITQAASRRMMQTAAAVLIIIGLFPKFAAFFVTMPDPVIGGLFCIMFGLVAGVGIANLKYCDLSSSRNIFIFGFSLFAGMAVPHWVTTTDSAINTSSAGLKN